MLLCPPLSRKVGIIAPSRPSLSPGHPARSQPAIRASRPSPRPPVSWSRSATPGSIHQGQSEAELRKRTLTNLYNQRPAWLDLAHQKLDQAVLDAYGWPHDLTDEQILERLAANLERAAADALARTMLTLPMKPVVPRSEQTILNLLRFLLSGTG
jgi:hypothetical protein